MLSWFGKTTDSAIQAYREFIAEGVGQERRPELVGGGQVRSGGSWSVVRGRSRQKVGDERILGGKVFVATVLREADEQIRRQLAVRRNQSGVSETIERVCRQAGVNSRELQAGSRRRPVSKIRALLAQRLVAEFGLSLAEVARQLAPSPQLLRVYRIARQNNSSNSTTSPIDSSRPNTCPKSRSSVPDFWVGPKCNRSVKPWARPPAGLSSMPTEQPTKRPPSTSIGTGGRERR